MATRRGPRRTPIVLTPLVASALAVVACVAPCAAQDRVFEQRPFDQIVLKPSAGGQTLKVQPLALPGRRVPNPLPAGQLVVRLVDQPAQPYEIAWSDIQRVELFEQVILNEATSLASAGKYDEAFDYFVYLHENYPQLPGLGSATARYLQRNAAAEFRAGRHDRALAILISLYERDPDAQGLARAVDAVADRIISEHLRARDLRAARRVLDVAEDQFGGLDLTVVEKWRGQFRAAADKRVREGAEALRAEDYRAARAAGIDALAILPGHAAAEELMRRVAAAYPALVVGVRTPAPHPLEPRIDSPESERVAWLVRPTVTRLTRYEPEAGPDYSSPVGRVSLDPSGTRLDLAINEQAATEGALAYQLSRWLFHAADPTNAEHDPVLASLAASVSVDSPRELSISLKHAHVRPAATLTRAPLALDGAAPATFEVVERTPQRTVLAAPDGARIAQVEERFYTDDAAALEALARGDIDVLDRVMPWQLAAVRGDRRLTVGAYALPSVHALIPTKRRPLLDHRALRRALAYGINRQGILEEVVRAGVDEMGFKVLSGPFPAGIRSDEAIRYAYNDGVRPRPYEPRLATILAALAWNETQKAEHGKDDPADRPFPTLRLAHGPDPVARSACQSIQMQLELIGVPIELVELAPGELLSVSPDFDLRYAELTVREPVVDAPAILGPEGVAGRASDPMVAALTRLENARGWNDTKAALFEIHALAAGDLPVIPLWQTPNYYAVRRDVGDPPQTVVSLYQILDHLRQ